MTIIKKIPSKNTMCPNKSRKTAILAYDNLFLFEYSIAIDLFAYPRPNLGVDWYDCQIICTDSVEPKSYGGVSINGECDLNTLEEMDIIIIPGWSAHDQIPNDALIRQIQKAHARGATLFSICSGAYLLAYSGVLDNKSATTHWLYIEDFKCRFPQINTLEDVLYVDNGNIITSAGSSAGIDAGLHLIRRDYGSKIANIVARRMVMPPHRDGGQAQYVEMPIPKQLGTSIGQVMEDVRQNLDAQITIKDFAAKACMSERTFLRHFIASNGIGPKEWLNNERINKSRVLIEETNLSIEQISYHCGFITPETFRIAFKRKLGVSPGKYRARFGTGA